MHMQGYKCNNAIVQNSQLGLSTYLLKATIPKYEYECLLQVDFRVNDSYIILVLRNAITSSKIGDYLLVFL